MQSLGYFYIQLLASRARGVEPSSSQTQQESGKEQMGAN